MTIRTTMAHHERESGAAATLLVVAGVIVGLVIFTFMVLPIATATDAKSRSRTAADAAALAGAEGVVGDLESILTSGNWSGGGWDASQLGGSGFLAAQQYVRHNDADARIVYYDSDLDGLTWFVEVEIESPPVKAGTEPVRSFARAEVGLPDCEINVDDPPPTPEPTPEPPPAEGEEPPPETEPQPEPEPEPTAPPGRTITCDGKSWRDEPTVEDPDYDLPGGLISALLDDLKPRLVA